MDVRVDEIADRIYRFHTFVPEIAPPMGFGFNQFLIDADEPVLFHCGPRRFFPDVSAAVTKVIPLERLRWIMFGHIESDECGAMNAWLAASPKATVAHGATACMVSLMDIADRPPRMLADGEVVDVGGRRVRWLDTPHVPHAWEAGLIYEETTGTLFSGDLFTQAGEGAAIGTGDILQPSIETESVFRFSSLTPKTGEVIRKLAALVPKRLAVMHGSSYEGDCAAALNGLGAFYDGMVRAAA